MTWAAWTCWCRCGAVSHAWLPLAAVCDVDVRALLAPACWRGRAPIQAAGAADRLIRRLIPLLCRTWSWLLQVAAEFTDDDEPTDQDMQSEVSAPGGAGRARQLPDAPATVGNAGQGGDTCVERGVTVSLLAPHAAGRLRLAGLWQQPVHAGRQRL
jgi:hypothetical protein